jgi:hypothetical protein
MFVRELIHVGAIRMVTGFGVESLRSWSICFAIRTMTRSTTLLIKLLTGICIALRRSM